jgi:hypothetical protein
LDNGDYSSDEDQNGGITYNEDGTMTVNMGGTSITTRNQGQGGIVNYFGPPPPQQG